MLEEGIYGLLTGTDAVEAIVGTRITPVLLPPDQCLPAVTYQLIFERHLYALDGEVNLYEKRLQFDVWANTWRKARTAAEAVEAVLNGYSGVLPGGIRVYGVQVISKSDGYESSARIFRVMTEYAVQYAS